ncbi:MAG: anion transporter [Burkholderiales bacterium]|nr:anion transporter [Burkholderiales bacterium]
MAAPLAQLSRFVFQLARTLARDVVILTLLAVLAVLTVLAPAQIANYPSLVDWPTMAALTGLLLLTKGVENSGALHRMGRWAIARVNTERSAALCLVLAAALLSTLLTNDVALFVVIPLTLGMCRITTLPATRLVVFEALAVNAGSALTPIGNPQNLFLWQLSRAPFGHFVAHMLPLVAVLMGLLLALTIAAFPARPMHVRFDENAPPLDRALLITALLLYLPFLVLADLHQAPWALAALTLILLAVRPRVLPQIDWGLLLVFILMFIDLRLLAGQSVVRGWMSQLDLVQPRHLFWAGVGASQIISNVPAAIALAEYSRDWQVIAYGVNIGGFGFMVGSLANLIALRMAGDRKAWLSFHAYSVPFLVISSGVGYVLLYWLHVG